VEYTQLVWPSPGVYAGVHNIPGMKQIQVLLRTALIHTFQRGIATACKGNVGLHCSLQLNTTWIWAWCLVDIYATSQLPGFWQSHVDKATIHNYLCLDRAKWTLRPYKTTWTWRRRSPPRNSPGNGQISCTHVCKVGSAGFRFLHPSLHETHV
jgi:hypothetical protein